MKDGPNIVGIAALIGDHARAEILTALMDGQALTATELRPGGGVTKQTISSHVAKLLDAGLVSVANQGRHRYVRLADDDVAHLLETLMGVAYRTGAVRIRSSPREPALRKARVRYDHLAGELGVLIFDSFNKQRLLTRVEDTPKLTRRGQRYCEEFGIDVRRLPRTTPPVPSVPRLEHAPIPSRRFTWSRRIAAMPGPSLGPAGKSLARSELFRLRGESAA